MLKLLIKFSLTKSKKVLSYLFQIEMFQHFSKVKITLFIYLQFTRQQHQINSQITSNLH